MSLFFDLRVTDGPTPSSLGLLEVQRTSHTDVSDPGADTWCTYTVRLDGRDVGTVQHRYGSGPWALAGKAASAAWAHRAIYEAVTPEEVVNVANLVDATFRATGSELVRNAIERAHELGAES